MVTQQPENQFKHRGAPGTSIMHGQPPHASALHWKYTRQPIRQTSRNHVWKGHKVAPVPLNIGTPTHDKVHLQCAKQGQTELAAL